MQKNTIGNSRYGEAYRTDRNKKNSPGTRQCSTKKLRSTLFPGKSFFTDDEPETLPAAEQEIKILPRANAAEDNGVMYFADMSVCQSKPREPAPAPKKRKKDAGSDLFPPSYAAAENGSNDIPGLPKFHEHPKKKRRHAKSGVFATFAAVCVMCVLIVRGVDAQNLPAADTGRTVFASLSGGGSYNDALGQITEDVRFYIKDGVSEPVELIMPFTTIGGAIAESGIVVGEEDSVNFPLDYMITDNLTIRIDRITYAYRESVEKIPFETKYIEVDTIKKGTTAVKTKGEAGRVTSYYRQTLKNGEIIDEVLQSETKRKEPVTEVVQKGVGGTFKAPDGKTYKYSYKLAVDAVAYGDPSDGTNPDWKGLTYSGMKAEPGVMAVDPRVIPLRSKVYVTGAYKDFGVLTAADTGSAIKGKIIDIFMATKAEMVKFGRRKMTAYILE